MPRLPTIQYPSVWLPQRAATCSTCKPSRTYRLASRVWTLSGARVAMPSIVGAERSARQRWTRGSYGYSVTVRCQPLSCCLMLARWVTSEASRSKPVAPAPRSDTATIPRLRPPRENTGWVTHRAPRLTGPSSGGPKSMHDFGGRGRACPSLWCPVRHGFYKCLARRQ